MCPIFSLFTCLKESAHSLCHASILGGLFHFKIVLGVGEGGGVIDRTLIKLRCISEISGIVPGEGGTYAPMIIAIAISIKSIGLCFPFS